MQHLPVLALSLLVAAACTGPDEEREPPPASACPAEAPRALEACVATIGAAHRDCLAAGDALCADDDEAIVGAHDDLTATVTDECAAGDVLHLTPEAAAERMAQSCLSQASALAWRAYGGPQARAWALGDEADQSCLTEAHGAAETAMTDFLGEVSACAARGDCTTAALDTVRSSLEADAEAAVQLGCPDLADLVAVDPDVFAARALHQADCLTAVAAPGLDVSLSCGPSSAEFEAPRGEWTQISVDRDRWGARCGDGSDYAFQIRLAPEGAPLDRVLIGLQGGGVCLFEPDCAARLASNPGLFQALDDEPAGTGIADPDPEANPFADWTMVFLPYCTQDVHIGGGALERFDDGNVVRRYGAVNVRAAVQMVRDVLWRELDADASRPDGFRPDQIHALFGGWSAGGYGALYNYHWMLDDLQWPRTAAFPDAGLAIDNGELLGVGGLGFIKIPAWGAAPYLPPYCFEGDCSAGPVLTERLSARLERVPEQQMMILSNPLDDTQMGDAFFGDRATWINAIRQTYCDTRDFVGVNYYLTSESQESTHVVSLRPEFFEGAVDGVVMSDWLASVFDDPASVSSHAEEADFVADVPGVKPFPCEP